MNQTKIKKITVCGFGLIGGSMALDLLKGRSTVQVWAYDVAPVLKQLKKEKRFKVKIESTLAKAVNGSDIIILAATHKANETMLKKLAKIKELSNCLIIDTGAVKNPISLLSANLSFSEGTQFLPTHPMAGKERSGFANAGQGLFAGHAWFIDEKVKLSDDNKFKREWMIKKLKANPVYAGSALHDEIVSEISHLPQLLSTILGAQVNPEMIQISGPGLKSMLRLAGSPYSVWSEIIKENRLEILESLRIYSRNLDKVIEMIKNEESLNDVFKAASRSYKCLS